MPVYFIATGILKGFADGKFSVFTIKIVSTFETVTRYSAALSSRP
jgi:hypothetical protein